MAEKKEFVRKIPKDGVTLVIDDIDFYNWLVEAENVKGATREEYEDCRSYYENEQAPSYVPDELVYVTENLVTDMVNGMVGALIGGGVKFTLSGGGPMAKPVIELSYDIFERNRFNARCMEPIGNYTYVEGMSGIEFYYNPRRKSIYGTGFPEIKVHRPEEVLLDPNSKGFLHEDDKIRALKTRVLVSYLIDKYKDNPELVDKIKALRKDQGNNETRNYIDYYYIEYIKTVFKKEDGIIYEHDEYWSFPVADQTLQLEEPINTEFTRFTIQPTIHTPREYNVKEPMGAVYIVKQTQDVLNSIGSLAYEAVKSGVKMFYHTKGFTQDEVEEFKKNVAKPGGHVNTNRIDAVIDTHQGQGISRDIVELYKWKRLSWDEISGRYAPERGASEQELSGVAIAQLQERGKTPELTKKFHIEFALSQVVFLIIECAVRKMKKLPFTLERNIDGQKRKIYYNTRRDQLKNFQEDEFNIVDEDGIVNNLLKIDPDEIEISVEISMDKKQNESFEANKAIALANMNRISTLDLYKVLYPNDYREKYENLKSEQQAMKIVEMINENPDAAPEMIQKLAEINDLSKQQIKEKV
jgi:hypothetical protein